ncbi:MAG: hypothetical protein IPI39_22005 [Candidatus Obscuribacter sp.]|nr:hypothetical protein [Candidatus Obscuribacter sp.]
MIPGTSHRNILDSLLHKHSSCSSYESAGKYSERNYSADFKIHFRRNIEFSLSWCETGKTNESTAYKQKIRVNSSGTQYRTGKENSFLPVVQEKFNNAENSLLYLVGNTTYGLLCGRKALAVFDDHINVDEPGSLVRQGDLLLATYKDSEEEILVTIDLAQSKVMALKSTSMLITNDAVARFSDVSFDSL